MSTPRLEYRGYSIELCSYEIQATPESPAGWVPQARIWYDEGGILMSFPLISLAVVTIREEADAAILALAKARIDSGNLPRRQHRHIDNGNLPRRRRLVTK
jgi:hypothetical protein